MGLLDLPAPLFAWVDAGLAELAPASLRLSLWALVGAAISMGLYLADWLKPWYVPFFGVLLLASLAIKIVARIE